MWLTLTCGERRRDLVLPETVPVVDLVPELARVLGALDPVTAYAGHRLQRCDGRMLEAGQGLEAQGIRPGDILTLVSGGDEVVPTVHDDPPEAMAAVVVGFPAWDASTGRFWTHVAAVVALLAGALALLLQRSSPGAAPAAAWASAVLVACSVCVARGARAVDTAVVSACAATVYAGVAGSLAVPAGMTAGSSAAAAGAGALAAAMAGAVGLGPARAGLVPPSVGGALLVATGLVVLRLGCDARVFLLCAVVVAVSADSWSPWLALRVSHRSPRSDVREVSDPPGEPVEPATTSALALRAHDVLVATSASVGVVLVLAAAPAVSLGVAGAATELLACLVVVLRTRHLKALRPVLAGVGSGLAGAIATFAAMVWLHRAWLPPISIGLAAAGTALLARGAFPRARGGGRVADAVESLSHVALVPTLVVATGALSALPG